MSESESDYEVIYTCPYCREYECDDDLMYDHISDCKKEFKEPVSATCKYCKTENLKYMDDHLEFCHIRNYIIDAYDHIKIEEDKKKVVKEYDNKLKSATETIKKLTNQLNNLKRSRNQINEQSEEKQSTNDLPSAKRSKTSQPTN